MGLVCAMLCEAEGQRVRGIHSKKKKKKKEPNLLDPGGEERRESEGEMHMRGGKKQDGQKKGETVEKTLRALEGISQLRGHYVSVHRI